MNRLLLVGTLLLTFSALTSAEAVTLPALDPGDPYRLAFLTSTALNPTSSKIADYNTFVNAVANAAGSIVASSGATWDVIGSTDTVSALANIGGPSSAPIYLLDGTLIATGTAELFSGNIKECICEFETGVTFRQDAAATGTNPDGSTYSGRALGDSRVEYGLDRIGFTDSKWIAYSYELGTSTYANQYYAISNVLTVPTPVPEPPTILLIVAGLMMMAITRYRIPMISSLVGLFGRRARCRWS